MRGNSSPYEGPKTAGKVIHWAPFYDVVAFLLTFGQEKRIRRETVELAGVSAGQSVLDVGCGTGSLTLAAKAATGPSGLVCGIDPSAEMVQAATKKAARAGTDIDFRVAAVEDLPFPDAGFDVVLSSLMLHHLPDEVKRKGFSEIARVLKPGGRFFAVDLAAGTHGLSAHLSAFFGPRVKGGLESMVPMLEAAGFKDVATGQMKFKPLGFISARRA